MARSGAIFQTGVFLTLTTWRTQHLGFIEALMIGIITVRPRRVLNITSKNAPSFIQSIIPLTPFPKLGMNQPMGRKGDGGGGGELLLFASPSLTVALRT